MVNNCKCTVCGKEFHACSSCGVDYEWEYTYCCEACWHKSKDYKSIENRIRLFVETLDKKQLKNLDYIVWDMSSEYCGLTHDIIKKKLATMV